MLLVCAAAGFSQGCSDAGFCTINGIKSEIFTNPGNTKNNRSTLKTGLAAGNTRYDVWMLNPYLDYSLQINSAWSISAKATGTWRYGKATSVGGLSDLIISSLFQSANKVGIVGAIKLPLSTSNRKLNNKSLPMAYQTSLGTIDLILGFQLIQSNWLFVAAWQQPITQNNNEFLMSAFDPEELGHVYPETNRFVRSGDVLIRVAYSHGLKTLKKNTLLTYSILPIYHLKDDEYTNPTGEKVVLAGSGGLTINANANINREITNFSNLELSVGFPLIARKVRPEGLSQFSLSLEYTVRF